MNDFVAATGTLTLVALYVFVNVWIPASVMVLMAPEIGGTRLEPGAEVEKSAAGSATWEISNFSTQATSWPLPLS